MKSAQAANKDNVADFLKLLYGNNPSSLGCVTKDGQLLYATRKFFKFFSLSDPNDSIRLWKQDIDKEKDEQKSFLETLTYHCTQALSKGLSSFAWNHQITPKRKAFARYTVTSINYHGENIFIMQMSTAKRKEVVLEGKLSSDISATDVIFKSISPISIWNADKKMLDCNDSFVKFIGQGNKKACMRHPEICFPPTQLSGEESLKAFSLELDKCFELGYTATEWLWQKHNGEAVPSRTAFLRIKYNEKEVIIVFSYDLRNQKSSKSRSEKSEEILKSMFANMPFVINILNKDLQIVDCNKAAYKIFGFDNKHDYLELFHTLIPEYQAKGRLSVDVQQEILNKAMDEGYAQFEWLHVDRYGSPLPMEITAIRTLYQGEDMIFGYAKDLREIKDMENKVSTSDRLDSIIRENVPLCIMFWNEKCEIVDCNREVLRTFKMESQQEYIRNVYNTSPEFQPDGTNSKEAVVQHITTAFKTGYQRFEWLHNTLDGELIPMEIILVRSTIGDEPMVISYAKDLRELKATQELVKEAELRNTLMLDSLPMAVHFWDDNFKLIYTNLEGANVFGFEKKEEYIKNFDNAIPEFQPNGLKSKDVILQFLDIAYSQGFSHTEMIGRNVLTNESIPFEVSIIRTSYRGKSGLIAYLKDLRQHYKMLDEISNNEKALREAKNIAEKSTQAKGEFLANMSHEIRTPMNGILGLLHLLEKTGLNKSQKLYVDKSLLSANNLMRIINDILDFSKIEAGKLEMESRPFTLQSICNEVKDLYSPLSAEKDLNLQVSAGSDHAETVLFGDDLRLKQVLFNLVSNAIKFTRSGSVSLEVQSTLRDNDELICQFAVRDTGIGLSPEQVSRLFSAFSQASTSITREYGGTGLGLVISRSIITMMRGNIWVESELGKGSTFFCTAMFKLQQEDDITEEVKEQALDTALNHAVNYKILLAEDNEINQLVALEILQSAGYMVDIANDGKEALEMLEKNVYDLILMDIQMPNMDGYTATNLIRRDAKYSELPVIAMSAHAMKGDKEISLSYGMNDHITKPISPQILYDTLQHWIQKSKNNSSN